MFDFICHLQQCLFMFSAKAKFDCRQSQIAPCLQTALCDNGPSGHQNVTTHRTEFLTSGAAEVCGALSERKALEPVVCMSN